MSIAGLRRLLQHYLSLEVKRTDAFAAARKEALVQEWNDNLKILNSAINRCPLYFLRL
jgi:hypothetical protein